MCYNARIDGVLTDENDYSACSIGKITKGYRLILVSGMGKPLRIEVENGMIKQVGIKQENMNQIIVLIVDEK